MSVTFLNMEEADFLNGKMLHKYMPLENALDSFEGSHLWFANPGKWKDPFEKRFIDSQFDIEGEIMNSLVKGKVFCTCFTETITSEAYWNTYSQGQIGINFGFNRENLYEALLQMDGYKIFIGKVGYFKTDEIINNPFECVAQLFPDEKKRKSIFLDLLLLKRLAYAYEDEIRIFVLKKTESTEDGIVLKFENFPNLLSRVVLHPSVEKNTEKLLKSVFSGKYGVKTIKSQLYAKAKPAIIKL